MRNLLLKTLKIAAFAYVALLFAAVIFEKSLIFQGKSLPPNFKFQFPGNWAERWYEPAPGVDLHALYFRSDSLSRRGVVLYFHGNRDNLARWGRHAPDFTRSGYDVLMVDYREYGKSSGKISAETDLHADARFVYEQLKKEISEDSLVLYGRSLGSGIATRLASETRPRMLLLETPYFNLPAVAASKFPLLPYAWLSRFTFRSDEWITRVSCPIHLFHGTADGLVPYSHSLRLAAKLGRNPAEILTTIPGGGHKNLAEFPAYQAAVDSCLFAQFRK
ncbi:MAG: alpha/beta fold hydrolase [Sphingobacteriaceae bacterium]|nr:alpha/beta fold hydrolase [Cytophagaceae bacterium]